MKSDDLSLQPWKSRVGNGYRLPESGTSLVHLSGGSMDLLGSGKLFIRFRKIRCMNRRILAPVILFIFLLPIICLPASSGECPPGSDCFLCGGVGGTPCTTNCQGVWDPGVNDYVSCRCPQGKACECYCPYVPTPSVTTVSIQQPVVSGGTPLVALIAMKQYDVYAPSMVDFSDESTGPVVSRIWDFGDDQRTSQLKSPTIIFSEPGTYVVTLTVVDAQGNKATDQVTVRVSPKPATGTSDEGASSGIPLPCGIILAALIVGAFLGVRKISP
jgi:hypothetical protein